MCGGGHFVTIPKRDSIDEAGRGLNDGMSKNLRASLPLYLLTDSVPDPVRSCTCEEFVCTINHLAQGGPNRS